MTELRHRNVNETSGSVGDVSEDQVRIIVCIHSKFIVNFFYAFIDTNCRFELLFRQQYLSNILFL